MGRDSLTVFSRACSPGSPPPTHLPPPPPFARLLAIRKRFDAASSVFDGAGALLGKAFGGDGKPSDAAATQNKAVAALVDFQAQMQDLQALPTSTSTSAGCGKDPLSCTPWLTCSPTA